MSGSEMVPMRPRQLKPMAYAFGEVACVPLEPVLPVTSIYRNQDSGRLVAQTLPGEATMGPLSTLKTLADIGKFRVECGSPALDAEINSDNYRLAAYLGGTSLLNLSMLEVLGDQAERLSLDKIQLWTAVIAEATFSALVAANVMSMEEKLSAKAMALTKIISTATGDQKLYSEHRSLGLIL